MLDQRYLSRPIAIEFTLTNATRVNSLTVEQREHCSTEDLSRGPDRLRVILEPGERPTVRKLESTPFGTNWEFLDDPHLSKDKVVDLLLRMGVQKLLAHGAVDVLGTAGDVALVIDLGVV